jgi:2-oxoglutarate dehydrogenase E1 component
MTPKSLLRLKDATSSLEEFTSGGFRPVIDDAGVQDWKEDVARLVLCTGKVFHDIERHPQRSEADEVAVARIERLYPFPTTELEELVASYPNLESVVWVQEEPMNLGAFRAVRHRLEAALPPGLVLEYEGRPWRSSPAEGYTVAHEQEQERIVRAALWLGPVGAATV